MAPEQTNNDSLQDPSKHSPPAISRFLPPIGSVGYHILLASVAIFILGPLGGISSAFMNFSIGFFVGGQVLAGILGSSVTLPYGPEGKHGANYMQTMAASVAGMCGMAVLAQAMVWLGLPEYPAWELILYFTCLGMLGVGIGMLYTPILVDRMQLTYPSGYAVANILRALTDKTLLRRSIAKLGGGTLVGYAGGLFALNVSCIKCLGFDENAVKMLDGLGISTSTVGAGMIVGARIAIPALVVALLGRWQKPHLVEMGWLEPGQPYRKIGFIISLGTILGAAMLDITLILIEAARRFRQQSTEAAKPAEDWKRVNVQRLIMWVAFWSLATVVVGHLVLGQPVMLLCIAIGLSFIFVLVNGISQGISDWNPISSAFVLTVLILAGVGLRDPAVGLMCAAIVLIACSEGGDMQQDRSTGWRLGTNRVVQFRYQVIGIAMGAVLAVALAKLFMNTYPILRVDQFANPNIEGAQKWQSAMTYKFVGALRGITNPKPYVMKAIWLGIGVGLFIEITRKLIKKMNGYKSFAADTRTGRVTDFLLDAVILPSPYASSFGGFVEIPSVLWWTAGGLIGSLYEVVKAKLDSQRPKPANGELPSDMSAMSLIGGGLIAGDSLAALTVGIVGLLKTLL